jgi:hypothetical protein
MRPQEQWTEEERQALAALGREAQPDAGLEERTVARLRREGLIGGPRASWWSRLPVSRRAARRRPARNLRAVHLGWASAAAACLAAAFLAGVTVGQQWALRSTAGALAAFQDDAVSAASARVQQTGSAYVAALAALGRLAASEPGQEVDEGREVALAALYAAAAQLVRLDPDDPVATRLLQSLDRAGTPGETADAAEARRQVVWF